MKPFLYSFIPLALLVLAAGYWALAHSFPIPGGDPLPDWYVARQAFAGRLFDAIIFPARWSGRAALFVGAILWALPPSLIIALIWRAFRHRAHA